MSIFELKQSYLYLDHDDIYRLEECFPVAVKLFFISLLHEVDPELQTEVLLLQGIKLLQITRKS